jgi:uncharacterized protein YozE (UPF0346 family)
MGFKAWLCTQRHRRDLIGDLAHDVCADTEWPRGRPRLRTLHLYLDGCDAVEGAHTALDLAWDAWQLSSAQPEKINSL